MELQHSKQNKQLASLGDAIESLQRRLAEEQDPIAMTGLYGELADRLREIQRACEADRTNLETLREIRKTARSSAGLDANFPAADLKAELERFELVTQRIHKLPGELLAAAKTGDEMVKVCYLDEEGAHGRNMFGFRRAPRTFQDLHSPAFKKLWNHLVDRGFAPIIYKETEFIGYGASIDRFWMAVKLPN